jgi:2-amino-4-hydroxy-6-hydroxymethyldihydropteridine diphosphokinase
MEGAWLKDPHGKVGMHVATVSVGSNLGNREAIMREAILRLGAQCGNLLLACSSLYETEPFGKTDQGWFLNCVIQVQTSQGLKAFFRQLQQAEALAGRVRQARWGPRTLDLDLLFFDDTVYSDSELTVPHPGVAIRRFVLEPLCEVAPDLVHPSLRETASALLGQVGESSRVVCLGRPPVQNPLLK